MEGRTQVGDIDKKVWEQQVTTITGGMATKAIVGKTLYQQALANKVH